MANLLYITCNIRPQDSSLTLSLGLEFLEEYLRRNPQDEVQVLDLYRDSIQRFDLDVHNAFGRITGGEKYGLHSYDELPKVIRILRLADQFSTCDKYVFVTHSLNLWFPAEFKMYIDAICVPDRTYRLTPGGAEGMLPDQRRKSLHLHAGPIHKFGQKQDMSGTYLSSILSFLGVTDQETVLLDGDDLEQGSKEECEAVRRRLLELARRF
jgi:FMN-dependent NADH-azoreductase